MYKYAVQNLHKKTSTCEKDLVKVDLLDRDCFRILKNLETTDEDCKDLAKCIKALESYFKSTQNEIYKQYIFYSCDEGPSENVDHWVNRLRQLLKSCNFEALIDSLLRDRVVMGTKYKAARARIIGMFREKIVNLNEAVDMLRASEIAAQHIKEIDQGTSEEVVSLCIVRYTSTSS